MRRLERYTLLQSNDNELPIRLAQCKLRALPLNISGVLSETAEEELLGQAAVWPMALRSVAWMVMRAVFSRYKIGVHVLAGLAH